MIDYGQKAMHRFGTENKVDEPLTLFGVHIVDIVNTVFGGMLIAIVKAPHYGAVYIFLAILWRRRCFKAECEGKPITFKKSVLRFSKILPGFLIILLLPSLYGADSYDDIYRQ